MYIYINGVSVALDTNTHNDSTNLGNAGDLTFMKYDTGYYSGNICNVGIWSAVLTQAQIKSIMWKNYAGLNSTETTNLVSWWNLSANANDDHGSNNGTLS